ncbi:hypothetical protein EV189_4037 [Motilibacter rhizosphaerae]|uniref:Uncharacterized protein n=1 Tax=Motilibacter rhizosphaerae TaxID=598652 RepID=A0A4Q7N7L1_9ACTN|nr:hypothetical protein EV189_4037 [Motilibacter rhizosphaerae]
MIGDLDQMGVLHGPKNCMITECSSRADNTN